jgi:hypothetical protein
MPRSTWLPAAPSALRYRDDSAARALQTGLSPAYLAYSQALQERQRQALQDAVNAGLRQPQRPAIHAMPAGFGRIRRQLHAWTRRLGRAQLERSVTTTPT